MANLKTRDKIVDVADRLFYEQGFEFTSFAHIAQEVGVSRGNFYHHFKTKDDILDAVIKKRFEDREIILSEWESIGETPKERILLYIKILIFNKDKIMKYGCPVGTLCSELSKLNHPMQDEASTIMTLFRQWLRTQFEQAGAPLDKCDFQALHVLAWSQGVATLASTFKDLDFVKREISDISLWVEKTLNTSIPVKKITN
jgi:TetR/AcrR family transcriptional regulator, transcriptional repressor for nem operon